MPPNEALQLLGDIRLFRMIPADVLSSADGDVRLRRLSAGSTLFRAGEPATEMFVITSGSLGLVSPAGSHIADLGPGDLFGEVAVLSRSTRTAGCMANTDSEIVAIPQAVLERFLRHGDFAHELGALLSRRLSASRERPYPRRIIAIEDATDHQRPTRALIEVLRDRSPATIGIAALEGSTVPNLTRGVERIDPFSVMDPASGAPPVVAVVLGDGPLSTALRQQVPWVLTTQARVHRHPSWQIHFDDGAGLARAVRWATGSAVGLVLSSGGSKTVAHIGVARVLKEKGIPVDAIVGSSGGAVVAAGLSLGFSPGLMLACVQEIGERTRALRLDWRLPRRAGGLARGQKLRDMFDDWFGGARIEDLPIPLAVVACDAHTGRPHTIDMGPLADATRASMSIPGVLAPWEIDGRYYLDGALAAPLPADVLRQRSLGVVIGVNATRQPANGSTPVQRPKLREVLSAVILAAEQAHVAHSVALCDVVVEPAVETSYSFDFTEFDKIIRAGEDAAREALAGFNADTVADAAAAVEAI